MRFCGGVLEQGLGLSWERFGEWVVRRGSGCEGRGGGKGERVGCCLENSIWGRIVWGEGFWWGICWGILGLGE